MILKTEKNIGFVLDESCLSSYSNWKLKGKKLPLNFDIIISGR